LPPFIRELFIHHRAFQKMTLSHLIFRKLFLELKKNAAVETMGDLQKFQLLQTMRHIHIICADILMMHINITPEQIDEVLKPTDGYFKVTEDVFDVPTKYIFE
jgi:cytochrome b involved in lipid metabolism